MPELKNGVLFSIVIPHYNDLENLFRCLTALKRQRGGLSFEIIVADDCSDMDVSGNIRGRFPEVICERLDSQKGPGAARNRGIRLARGKYLAFVDSDAEPCLVWLETFAQAFEQGAQVICGPVLHGEGWLDRLTALTSFGEYLEDKNGFRNHCPSVNFAAPVSIIKEQAYDESISFAGEDMVFSTNLILAGYSICYRKDAWVMHRPKLSIVIYSRRAFRYGIGFRESRMRCPQLSGYWMHKYLGPLSSFALFFVRTALDVSRLAKYRRLLRINIANIVVFLGAIVWTRACYCTGVFLSYFLREENA